MKRITTALLSAVAAMVLLAGCKGKDSVANDPKAVIVAFFDRMAKKDFDGAAKLATADSKATIDMMKKAMTAAEGLKDKMGGTEAKEDPAEDFKNMEMGEAKIDGDNAIVPVTNKKKGKTTEFALKKEGGSWKVDFSMASLMKMGMNGADDNEMENNNSGMDTATNNINLDGLKDSLSKALEVADSALKQMPDKVKDAMKELNEKVNH